ncbi:protein mis12 [Anaeramoeba flamelloides]|uniref:Protein mis12 n=1 Tax=Anaeramoeba flamelloides TaxID=1746091 RepID=A0ABQ8XI76_9EUKA|nr:protein mis12 [Anaeramoeba flamelloides]
MSVMSNVESFFGWKPEEFVDDIANATSDFLCDGVDAIESCLISDVGLSEKKEIKKGCDSFLTHMQKTIDKNFDRFELYILRNIFTVPTNYEELVKFDPKSNQLNKKKKKKKLNSFNYKNIESSSDEFDPTPNSKEMNSKISKLDQEIQELQEEIQIQTKKNRGLLRKKNQLITGIENFNQGYRQSISKLQNVQSSFNLNSVTELTNQISTNYKQLQEIDQTINKMKKNETNEKKNNTKNYHTKFLENRSTTNDIRINQLSHFNKKISKK